MKYSALAIIRKMLKAENNSFGKFSTLAEVRQKVLGHPETIARAYRMVVAEIKAEDKVAEDLARSLGSVEDYVNNDRKMRYFYTAALSFSFGFLFGALLLIL